MSTAVAAESPQIRVVYNDKITRQFMTASVVFGLVGSVFTATHRWLSREVQRPDQEAFVRLVTETVWLQIAGMAKQRGVELDPDLPVETLLETALDGAAG